MLHSPPPTPPMTGDLVASYTLLDSIGLGGNATVFKAESPKFGVVAIKILHPGKLTELDTKRFHREFEIMKTLDHPNIIEVFESGMHGPYPWMSMELVSGGDLNDKVAQWNSDTVQTDKYQQITLVLSELCAALDHLHSKRIIHRDLKPSNILLTEFGQVKLTDFGGVKAPHSFKTDLTTLGALVGTVAFMAPEQILGEPVDHRTDLYTLGAILYMCLTGAKPFEANTMAAYLAKHLSQNVPNPASVRPETPEYLSNLSTTLMQKSPKDRIQSAKDVLIFLRNKGDSRFPFGTKPVLTEAIEWIEEHSSGILLLFGHHGMNTKASFMALRQACKDLHLQVQTEYVLPEEEHKSILLCTRPFPENTHQFITTLQTRIQNGAPIICVVNTVDKWQQLTAHLSLPTKKLALPTLNIDQIQQLLQPFGLTTDAQLLLAKKMHTIYKGRVEYIQEVLSTKWAHRLSSLTLTEIQRESIPSSNRCLEYQKRLWQQVPTTIMTVLSPLLVFCRPISPHNLSRLTNIPNERLMPIITWLVDQQWVELLEQDMNQQVRIHPLRFGEILYRLIPTDQQILWHQRIASFLLKKSRLRTDDRLQIVEHLDKLGPSTEANKQRLHLAKQAHKKQQWHDASLHLESIHTDLLTEDHRFQMFQLGIDTYQAIGNSNESQKYLNNLLAHPNTSSTLQHQLHFRKFILDHQEDTTSTDDTSLDEQWHTCNLEDQTQRNAMILRANQAFFYSRLDLAKQLWQSLTKTFEGDIPEQQAQLGLAFIEDCTQHTDRFMQYLSDQPEHQQAPWHIWYLERLLTTGQWTQLSQHLVERRAFERYGIVEEIFAAWIDFVQGNAPRARERVEKLTTLVSTESSPSKTQLLLHLLRLQKRLHLPLSTPNIRWSQRQKVLEAHVHQWRCLQQGHLFLDDSFIFWHRDLMLFDAALFPLDEKGKQDLWSGISTEAWGIKIQLSKRFSDERPHSQWQEIHEQTIANCARHMTNDIHIWS